MRFQRGHLLAREILEYIGSKYNGLCWPCNGPLAVTNVVKSQHCITNAASSKGMTCNNNTTVLPQTAFFSIPWQQFEDIFDASKKSQVLEQLTDSYAMHLWNSKSSQNVHGFNSTAFDDIASKNCPHTYPLLT